MDVLASGVEIIYAPSLLAAQILAQFVRAGLGARASGASARILRNHFAAE